MEAKRTILRLTSCQFLLLYFNIDPRMKSTPPCKRAGTSTSTHECLPCLTTRVRSLCQARNTNDREQMTNVSIILLLHISISPLLAATTIKTMPFYIDTHMHAKLHNFLHPFSLLITKSICNNSFYGEFQLAPQSSSPTFYSLCLSFSSFYDPPKILRACELRASQATCELPASQATCVGPAESILQWNRKRRRLTSSILPLFSTRTVLCTKPGAAQPENLVYFFIRIQICSPHSAHNNVLSPPRLLLLFPD